LPPRLSPDKFSQLDHLPNPMPGIYGHYKKFSEVLNHYCRKPQTVSSKYHQEAPTILPISTACEKLQQDVAM